MVHFSDFAWKLVEAHVWSWCSRTRRMAVGWNCIVFTLIMWWLVACGSILYSINSLPLWCEHINHRMTHFIPFSTLFPLFLLLLIFASNEICHINFILLAFFDTNGAPKPKLNQVFDAVATRSTRVEWGTSIPSEKFESRWDRVRAALDTPRASEEGDQKK